jgi:hypothetical protein
MAVYTPLRARGWSRAVAASALVGAFVDTYAFLSIAGFPLTTQTVGGQLLVKVGISWAVAATVAIGGGARALLREPVHAVGT